MLSSVEDDTMRLLWLGAAAAKTEILYAESTSTFERRAKAAIYRDKDPLDLRELNLASCALNFLSKSLKCSALPLLIFKNDFSSWNINDSTDSGSLLYTASIIKSTTILLL